MERERRSGITPAELLGEQMPYVLRHVWEWFLELSATRQTGMGFSPISYTEIRNWADLTGRAPLPYEVRLIRRIDIALRDSLND